MLIDSRKKLYEVLSYEKERYFVQKRSLRESIIMKYERPLVTQIWQYQVLLRKNEYYLTKKTKIGSVLLHIVKRKRNILGGQISLEIYPGCFAEGLLIYHTGIVVNGKVKAGKNCVLHGNNCIGNKGNNSSDSDLKDVPIIGDNVDIGYGAVLIGNVAIADGCTIGANAVVNKTFEEKDSTIIGVPAKVKNDTNKTNTLG